MKHQVIQLKEFHLANNIVPNATSFTQLVDLLNKNFGKPIKNDKEVPLHQIKFNEVFYLDNGCPKLFETPLKILINDGQD